jgi:hypothetical protein
MNDAPPLHEIAGVLHVHSTYSDGTGTVPQIAAAAQANDLDFVLLTDHDTLAAKDSGEEGWHDSVLVLIGEEISPYRENHYLAFGLDQPIDHRGLECGEIVERVNEAGGFGFLSHPFSKGSERFRRGLGGMPWRDIDCGGYTGLELWSFVTDGGEQIRSIPDVFRFILTPGRFIDHPPRANLEAWDRLCGNRRCVALGGIDAHQVGIRIGNHVPLRLMAYRRSFRYLRTHLLIERPLTRALEDDRELLFSALREGHAFIAMDALAPAHGFRFWAEGPETLTMGDESQAAYGEWILRATLPQAARLRLMRNGEEVASADEAREIEYPTADAGVYRLEAHRRAHGRERTWILSNPIYLR